MVKRPIIEIRMMFSAIVLCLVVGMLMVVTISWRGSYQSIQHTVRNQVSTLSNSIVQALQVIMLNGGGHDIERYIERVKNIKSIKDIRIVRAPIEFPSGILKGSYPPTDLEKQVLRTGEETTKDLSINGDKIVSRVVPVRASEACLACHTHVKKSQLMATITTTIDYKSAFNEIVVHICRMVGMLLFLAILLIVFIERLLRLESKQLLAAQGELERGKHLSDIGTLAAMVAHELRNPLAAIGLAINNIERKAKNPDLDKHVSTINKKVAEGNQIINDLLFYTRVHAPTLKSVDLYSLLEECADGLVKRTGDEIQVIKKIDAVVGLMIDADETQLEEVFNNILNNAYDALVASHGQITVTANLDGSFVVVTIEDNGTGIDKENLDRLFDPFFTTKAKGTGLGLAVCHQIIKAHQGEIGITSQKAKGTTVTIRLPKKIKT